MLRVVERAADQGGRAVGRQRDARAELPAAVSPLPVSLPPCWLQAEPGRVKTQAAPLTGVSVWTADQGGRAVRRERNAASRSADAALAAAVSLPPCWSHAEPERVNTQAAPLLPSSKGPPMSAVEPSPDSATLTPKRAWPVSPLPVSLPPC